jgi:4-carboxymuconolactone decarboxylase
LKSAFFRAAYANSQTIGESTMSARTETLGGRLPLLDPLTLSPAQKATYEHLNNTWIPWANGVPFQSKLDDGRLIGPFNPILFSPAISLSFLALQETEQKDTSLTKRVREVVILAVGSVWKSKYELYAHGAVARKAGIAEDAIRMLTVGDQPDELSEPEKIAQRYALQLSTEHHVGAVLYSEAEQAFGQRGLVEITYLTGIYHIVCALEIPVPGSQADR